LRFAAQRELSEIMILISKLVRLAAENGLLHGQFLKPGGFVKILNSILSVRLMTLAVAAIFATAFASFAIASEFSNTENCVIVYVKEQVSQPNLTMACDGNRVVEKMVKRESELADAKAYKNSLYADFQSQVNENGTKVCNEYDLDGVWWAACLTP
jgi:hypothetical protein